MTDSNKKPTRKQLLDALMAWEKFAYYAMGKSGHTPLTMNLWLATLFSAAHELSSAVTETTP